MTIMRVGKSKAKLVTVEPSVIHISSATLQHYFPRVPQSYVADYVSIAVTL
jgi:hypothetical protein